MASFDRRHAEAVAAEFARQPLGASVLLVEADIAGLPAPVKRYIRASGAIGHPRPQNVRVAFDALMRRKPGADPMVSTSVQYNFFGQPARLFLMRARMFGVPVIPKPHMWQSASSHVLRSRRATASPTRAPVAAGALGSLGARSVHTTQTAATARAESGT